ncbi:MAG: four helix bundle protein [Desulfobulbaceae bacterium]
MARYEHLPIYRTAMELCVYLENTVKNFSRYHKYAIGAELRELSREVLRLIIQANSLRDREDVLRGLVRHCDMLAAMLALAKEVKAFASFTSFQHAAGLAVSLSRQGEGWLKSSRAGQNRRPRYAGGERAHEHCAPPPPVSGPPSAAG